MSSKREIRVYRWDDRRDQIIYKVHRYSDGTSWYENVGRLGSKTRERLKGSSKSKPDRASSKRKGQEFEDRVVRLIGEAARDRLTVFRKWSVMGSAGDWETDIAVYDSGDFDMNTKSGTFGPVRAVVECKYLKPEVAGGSYTTSVYRACTLLNDIKLNSPGTRLFLVVNRLPKKGETPRDPKTLLGKIDANFINFDDQADQQQLRQEIAR